MIHPYDLFKNIQTILKEFADAEFQERVWVRGEGEEVSNWTEAMCKLFDDYQFDDFLDKSWPKLGLSEPISTVIIYWDRFSLGYKMRLNQNKKRRAKKLSTTSKLRNAIALREFG
ncbi:hypothetical protein [Spirulina sp. 06S082]|uniref:hypothetical protein n=1 Tax=Spirulina sp. 06S082 TaxID=3110248 RepID=UPI002B1EAC8E|nr:hypothetical protein [Spirulina sp. 06S082]MEA5470555.1 hypothetical protein [Spirulina sp. 06S082]